MSDVTSEGLKSLQFTTAKTCRLPQSLHWTKRPSWPQVHAVYNCLHAHASLSKPGGLDGLVAWMAWMAWMASSHPQQHLQHTHHILMLLIVHCSYSAPLLPEFANPLYLNLSHTHTNNASSNSCKPISASKAPQAAR